MYPKGQYWVQSSIFINDLDKGQTVPLASLQMTPVGRSGWYARRSCCYRSAEMSWQEPHGVQQGELQNNAPVEEQPHTPVHCSRKSAFLKRPWGFWWTSSWTWASNVTFQQRKQMLPWTTLSTLLLANGGCWSFSFIQHWWGSHLAFCVWCWTPQYRRELDITGESLIRDH